MTEEDKRAFATAGLPGELMKHQQELPNMPRLIPCNGV